eukprot:262243_1
MQTNGEISEFSSSSGTENGSVSAKTDIVKFNNAQKMLLRTITKHTVLYSLIIFMLIILIIIFTTFSITGLFNYEIFGAIYLFMTTINADLNVLFIYLGFPINKKHYYCLLLPIDKLCTRMCHSIASNKVTKLANYVSNSKKEDKETSSQPETSQVSPKQSASQIGSNVSNVEMV